MTTMRPIDVAVALSLCGYNVSPRDRALAIFNHFRGACADMEDLVETMQCRAIITELAAASASVYVEQAMLRYGEEAKRRNVANGI